MARLPSPNYGIVCIVKENLGINTENFRAAKHGDLMAVSACMGDDWGTWVLGKFFKLVNDERLEACVKV